MTPADLDGIEADWARAGTQPPLLTLALFTALRAAWAERDETRGQMRRCRDDMQTFGEVIAERDVFRADAEKAHKALERVEAERDAYHEAFESHVAHALGRPSPIAAIDRLDAALVALRAVGWSPEGESP